MRRVARRLAVVAVIALLTAWTNEWHGLFWGQMTLDPSARCTRSTGRGPGFYLNVTYTYCVLFAGLAILVVQADSVAVSVSQAHGDPGARPPCCRGWAT